MTDDHAHASDGHWLTYAEAAQLLGRSAEGIRALARREGWPRQTPNGVGLPARVLVPRDLVPSIDKTSEQQHANSERDRGQPPATVGHSDPPDRHRATTADHERAEGQPPSELLNGYARSDQWPDWRSDRARPSVTDDQSDALDDDKPMTVECFSNDQHVTDGSTRRLDTVLTDGHVFATVGHNGATVEHAEDHRRADVLQAMRDTVELLIVPLREQLNREGERADRANERAAQAEGRIRELQDKLEAAELRIADKEASLTDLRTRLDTATAQLSDALQQVRALADQRPPPPPPARRSWWPWRR